MYTAYSMSTNLSVQAEYIEYTWGHPKKARTQRINTEIACFFCCWVHWVHFFRFMHMGLDKFVCFCSCPLRSGAGFELPAIAAHPQMFLFAEIPLYAVSIGEPLFLKYKHDRGTLFSLWLSATRALPEYPPGFPLAPLLPTFPQRNTDAAKSPVLRFLVSLAVLHPASKAYARYRQSAPNGRNYGVPMARHGTVICKSPTAMEK